MTTIAYDGLTLACDSRQCNGERINQGKYQKIWQIDDDTFYTFAGSVEAGMRMLAYLNEDSTERPLWDPASTVAVLVPRRGLPRVYEGTGIWFTQKAKLNAWGSGSDYAMGALVAGADAVSAVKAAIKLDPMSGGPVRSLCFG